MADITSESDTPVTTVPPVESKPAPAPSKDSAPPANGAHGPAQNGSHVSEPTLHVNRSSIPGLSDLHAPVTDDRATMAMPSPLAAPTTQKDLLYLSSPPTPPMPTPASLLLRDSIPLPPDAAPPEMPAPLKRPVPLDEIVEAVAIEDEEEDPSEPTPAEPEPDTAKAPVSEAKSVTTSASDVPTAATIPMAAALVAAVAPVEKTPLAKTPPVSLPPDESPPFDAPAPTIAAASPIPAPATVARPVEAIPTAAPIAATQPKTAAVALPANDSPFDVPSHDAYAKTAPEPSKRVKSLAPPPDNPFGGGESATPYETPVQNEAMRSLAMPAPSGAQWRRVMDQVPIAPPEAVLHAQNLIKRFGRREVVKGVELQVGAGEIVGLLGRNGAGKTTTFRMIMGLLSPDKGKVLYEGRDVSRLPMYERANRGIGYLAQQPCVFQRMTVEDNLLAVLELQETNRRNRKARLEELIQDLGLQTVRKSMAAVLSGGERRRLEIARAMSLRPRIVLFDEPFAGIDPITVTEIQGILRDLKSQGVGVLLTDHNVRETLTITDRTYIMDDGKIWIHGPPREIVANPEARARYLGQDFRLDF